MENSNDHPYKLREETMHSPEINMEAKSIAERVANKILGDTKCRFRNVISGECSDQPGSWPLEQIGLESGYNDWKYWNGVVNMALLQLATEFDQENYKKLVLDSYRFAFDHQALFQQIYNQGIPNAPLHQFFRLDRLDDFGAMAAGLIEVLKYDSHPGYEVYLDRVANYINDRQDRLADGTFCRRRFGITTLWADDLFMSVPLLVGLFKMTGDERYLEDALLQSDKFHEHLFRRDTELYHHCKYMETGKHGVAHWSRANGWVLMARIMLMDGLPSDHPGNQRVANLILDQVVGLSRFQAGDGFWHQLIDKPDSFRESSGTSMFTYGVARAVNQGWIPDYYSSIALRGWDAIKNCIAKDGKMDKVSQGFNIRQDLPFYYKQAIEEDGAHGVGAFLLAGLEVSKMKTFRDCVWC